MGEIKSFDFYKLIIGVLTTVGFRKDEILESLSKKFGEIDFVSHFLDFNYTNYYNSEMGDNIKRFFVSFKELIDPSALADIKIRTNELEKLFVEGTFSQPAWRSRNSECSVGQSVHSAEISSGGLEARKVNFDPGILNQSRLILASTKDNAHRMPLYKGIFGEITLLFQKQGIQTFPWTFKDFRSPEYAEILLELRSIYKAALERHPADSLRHPDENRDLLFVLFYYLFC